MPTKTARPAGTTKPSDTAKPTRSSAGRRAASPRTRAKKHPPAHGEIAERAYFIHIEEGSSDELANWLRAERELMPA